MSEEATTRDPGAATRAVDEETGLLDFLLVLTKRKRLVLGLPVAAAVVAATVSFLLPNIYTATTKIVPPQQGQSSTAALLAQFGALVGGAPSQITVRSPIDLYVGMLKSRTLADSITEQFELKKVYETTTQFDTRRKLAERTTITSGRDGIITVEFEDTDPGRAAAIANAYADELHKLTISLAVTEASQRRLFYETQMKQAREQLALAEVSLRQAIDKGGLAGIDVQSKAILEPSAQLRAQIAVRQVQLDAIRIFATENHPDIERFRHEIASMRRELRKLEEGDGNAKQSPASPEGLENLQRFRDVKFLERMTQLLAQQFESAKIDEARDASIVQVLDKAVEPEKKSKPRRALIVGITMVLAAFIGVLAAAVLEGLERARTNPGQLRRLELIRQHLRWR